FDEGSPDSKPCLRKAMTRLATASTVVVFGQKCNSAWGEFPPQMVTSQISTAWNTRSRNRRQVGLSASPNNDRLCRRITPWDGNETHRSRAIIRWDLARTGLDEFASAEARDPSWSTNRNTIESVQRGPAGW